MARGGKRDGAGRKKGAATQRTAAIKVQAVKEGITPAEVMQTAMEKKIEANDWDGAAALAKDLAPYRHPRLAAIQHSGGEGPPIKFSLEKAVSELQRQKRDRVPHTNGATDGPG